MIEVSLDDLCYILCNLFMVSSLIVKKFNGNFIMEHTQTRPQRYLPFRYLSKVGEVVLL